MQHSSRLPPPPPLPSPPPRLGISTGRSSSASPSSSASSSSSQPSTSSSPLPLHFPPNSRISRYSYDTDQSGQHVHVTPSLPPPPPLMSSSSSSSSSLSSLRQRANNTAPTVDIPPSSSSSGPRALVAQFTSDLKSQRRKVRLLTSPLLTIQIFSEIVVDYFHTTISYLLSHRLLLYSLVTFSLIISLLYAIPGSHQIHLSALSSTLTFCLLWLTLGVLSSVGLGTGLHTFVLYLGPYIAKTTLAVTECNTLDIALEGPEAFLCPHKATLHTLAPVTFVGLLWKVAPAALLWGAGTAMGELPPYFVSRAATLSGQKLAELDKLNEIDEEQSHPSSPTHPQLHPKLSLADHAKLLIYHALQRYGFWAIVLFASIPNPLFDLAGLACGHFLIPFWTFFGATCIGKAVIKAQLQTAIVIVAFNRERLEGIVHTLEARIGFLKDKLGPFFEKQRQQFHVEGGGGSHRLDDGAGGGINWLSLIWNGFLISMILWFVMSIIDSSVQERLAMKDQGKIEKFAQEKGVDMKLVKEEK